MDLNLTSALLCARAVGPHMLERGSGSLITIGSFAGRRGGAGTTLYAAGKSGTDGFTRALALEWAPHGVRVNGIAPGSFPDRVTAGDLRTPRTVVEVHSAEMPVSELGELFSEWTHSRVPVVEEGDRDKVVGMVQRREVVDD